MHLCHPILLGSFSKGTYCRSSFLHTYFFFNTYDFSFDVVRILQRRTIVPHEQLNISFNVGRSLFIHVWVSFDTVRTPQGQTTVPQEQLDILLTCSSFPATLSKGESGGGGCLDEEAGTRMIVVQVFMCVY